MTTTSHYGVWNQKMRSSFSNPRDEVAAALNGEWSEAFVDAAAAAYVVAINDALPDGVSLHGAEFIGPHAERDFEGYPHTEDDSLDIAAIIAGVNLGAIVERLEESGLQ